MTRKENSGARDLNFSGWIREKLPCSSEGFMVTDVDFILWNYKTRRLMLIEVKQHKAIMKKWQILLYGVLDELLKNGSEKLWPPVNYFGWHCIRFENTDFSDGRCMLNNKLITEKELIEFMSMNDESQQEAA